MIRITLLLMLCANIGFAQAPFDFLEYEPNDEYPYGRLNPTASPELGDYREMIGTCDCKSLARNPDQTWADTADMIWKFKYIMNGTAVQDEVWRENNQYAGSIRQFQPDSAQWVVSYFSNPGIPWSPGIWHGKRTDQDEIILYRPQKAPNGMDGYFKIRFYDLSEDGFNWLGQWVDEEETIQYPTWKIFCNKRKE